MRTYYSVERNVQILISLMKKHGIRKIIVSPGMTNICFVASVQQDPFFELYSVVDERSAAYMACGLAAESGEAVAISCTGATASRNYVPGLTEAFYRKLPVLAITSSQPNSRIGHNIPQVTDRRDPMPDIVKLSVQLPVIHDSEDEWDCVIKTNQALLELFHRGGGPVHINLTTMYVPDFSAQELGNARFINRICQIHHMPELRGKTAIFVGAHLIWSSELIEAVDAFCEKYNAVVLCDHTSNYNGKYGVFGNLVANQSQNKPECCFPDILIHIGDVSGAYMQIKPKEVWRVNPDGEIRDTFRKLKYVFEMSELAFFQYYATAAMDNDAKGTSYYEEWAGKYAELRNKLSQVDLPFSGAWAAMAAIARLPDNAVLHLGILNSLRCWNYFSPQRFIPGYSNTGGFGIDGCVSSMIGASLADRNKLFFGVVGDLAFFYDLNVLGNRNVGSNIRIMLVNNGKGFEFKHYGSFPTQSNLGDIVDPYIAAAGHNGRQSPDLVRHFAEDLGFNYISASDKTEFLEVIDMFMQQISEKPILFELFTSTNDENAAQKAINNLDISAAGAVKHIAKNILGEKGVKAVKKILDR